MTCKNNNKICFEIKKQKKKMIKQKKKKKKKRPNNNYPLIIFLLFLNIREIHPYKNLCFVHFTKTSQCEAFENSMCLN